MYKVRLMLSLLTEIIFKGTTNSMEARLCLSGEEKQRRSLEKNILTKSMKLNPHSSIKMIIFILLEITLVLLFL